MERSVSLLAGMGLGAGLMYFLDPQLGRRRRAHLRDQAASATSRLDDRLGATWTDVRQRAQGLAAETRARFAGGQAPDHIVAERVRSKIGRYVAHPAAIEVAVRDSRVTLGGPVLAHEVDDLLCAVNSVPGVTGVENRLEVHREPGNVPGLQGGQIGRAHV